MQNLTDTQIKVLESIAKNGELFFRSYIMKVDYQKNDVLTFCSEFGIDAYYTQIQTVIKGLIRLGLLNTRNEMIDKTEKIYVSISQAGIDAITPVVAPTKTIPKMLPVTPAEEKEVQDVVKAMQAFLNKSETGVARYEITLANGRMFTTSFRVFANARTTLIKQQERKVQQEMMHIETLDNLTHQDVINALQDDDIDEIVSLLRSGEDDAEVIAHVGEYETFYGHFTFQVDDVEITVEGYDSQHVVLY